MPIARSAPLRRLTVALLTAAACALPPAAQAQTPAPALPAGVAAVTQVEGIAAYRLANGLQVLLVPDATKPSTTVNLTYHVGSRHENYGETGMAHLLEHLIFKGTPTQRNVMGEFSRRGLRFNGSTGFDRTNYFASFSASDETLRWYLAWQADAMVNSLIARSDLDSEMTVVRNEMEAGENNPVRATLEQTLATMYQWHNYGKSPIGARADVENVDIGRLQAFYRLHYQPDNATLVVAGSFDPARVLAWVAQSFGPIPRPTRVLPPTYTVDPVQKGERTTTVRRRGGAPFLLAGWHGVPAAHPDFAATEAIAAMLGNAPSGRLHKRLVEPGLAASSFGFTWGVAEPGPLLLGLQLAPGQDVDKARQALLAAIDGLDAEPFTAEELERVRTQWLNDWAQGFADPERVGVALSEAIGNGDWRLFFLARDRMRQLTLADVNRVARAMLVPDNRTLGTYLPTDSPKRAPEPALVAVAPMVEGYRGDTAVAQAEAFDATPANLDARTQVSTLASGLKVALLPKGTRGNRVQARLVLRFGDVDSLRGRKLAVAMMGDLIDKGGAGMTRAQISDTFDKLRAEVGFNASGQALSVGITTVREHLPAVVALVGRLLREPAFPADALEERRRQTLAGVAAQRSEPGAVAGNALQRHGNPYPRGDLRYAPSFDELVAAANAIGIDAVRAVHRRFLSAAAGEFSAVGDMDVAAVRTALDQAFGDWKAPADGVSAQAAYLRVPQPLVPVPPARLVLPTPDKPNANLLLEQSLAVNDTDPDYPALLMANHLLGGDASARLWARIREKDGLSYDVRSFAAWSSFEPNTPWRVSAIFAPQNQARVEAALQEETARALKDGFTQAELDAARIGLLNQRRLARAQDGAVAGALVSNLHLGRRFARQQQVDDAIAALTPAQVNAALRRHIDPAKWVVVWAGDFKP
ncbi:MAG TPA: pitrilysin family protein [Aquabacterium sp.]|nr:pitrilysin family protein [Aquabacterium sp.]